MKRLTLVLLVCVCALLPTAARADDGSFLDMLLRWDPKFIGFGSDFHIVCLDANGARVPGCEEWFKNFRHLFSPDDIVHSFEFGQIKHEIDFRPSFMWTYGELVPGPTTANDTKRLYALKLMGMYHYWATRDFAVGVGAGAIPIWGQNVSVTRGIVTPVSLLYSPPGARALVLRAEESFITGDISGPQFGHSLSTFTKGGEWNLSFTAGFDLRRIGRKAP